MKKRVYLLVASILVISIISAQFADAGFFDIFRKKEPNLAPTNVPINVNVDAPVNPPVNNAPIIKRFIPLGPQSLTNGYALIGFLAEDADGSADLPNALTIGTNILGGVRTPVNSITPNVDYLFNQCSAIDCNNPAYTSLCDSTNLINQKLYLCSTILPSHVPPSTSTIDPNSLWKISAIIADNQGAQSAIALSGNPGFTSTPDQFLQINALISYDIATTSSISWPASLSRTASNQQANSPITLTNTGNVPFNSITITGGDLIGTTNPTASLSISAFSASPSFGGVDILAQCDVPATATQLTVGVTTILGANIPYTGISGASSNLYFCAYQSLNTPGILTGTDTSYSGQWTITAS